ncbi:MAG: Polyketide cyclase / dehydrase and lipid transport [Bacteroidetes bacterium HLUCCA01]|nr:MAG: Polyketide cyclase / dehydrase and lipid transport [Bacteroidetes bacterium HLUCCA01]
MDTYYHVSVRSAVIAIAKLKLTTPRSITLLMAHENIEVNLPLAKVYELMSSPVDFPKFMKSINQVNKINSQTFEYVTEIGGEEFRWTTNIIDDLRNTRFAWITINGNLNQTGTIRFTPLDNGTRTRVDFSLDYRTFFGDPSEDVAAFIANLSTTLQAELQAFKEAAEAGTLNDDTEVSQEATA